MEILLRYACLVGIGLASLFTFVSATAVTGERLAAAGGYAVQDPADAGFGFWLPSPSWDLRRWRSS